MEKLATIAVHAGSPEGDNAPLTTPVVQSTTFRFSSAAAVEEYGRGKSGLYMYSRDENPTVRAAEQAVAALEGGEACVLFGSGMGAMTAALVALLSGGDEVVASTALYGGTYKLLRDVLSRFGVRARFVTPENLLSECSRGSAKPFHTWLSHPRNGNRAGHCGRRLAGTPGKAAIAAGHLR